MDAEARAQLVEVVREAILRDWWGEEQPTEHDTEVAHGAAEAVVEALQIESRGRWWKRFDDELVSDDEAGDELFTVGVLSLPPQKESAHPLHSPGTFEDDFWQAELPPGEGTT